MVDSAVSPDRKCTDDIAWRTLPLGEKKFAHLGFAGMVADFMRLKKTDQLLEVGCQAGQTACKLAPLVDSFLGIDPDRLMILQARERAEEQSLENVIFQTSGVT